MPADQPDLLSNIFAQFGVDLTKGSDQEVIHEDKKEPEFERIQLPDFSTTEFKVKKILDAIPDFSYLF